MKEFIRFWIPMMKPVVAGLLLFDHAAVRRAFLLGRLQREFGLVEIGDAGNEGS